MTHPEVEDLRSRVVDLTEAGMKMAEALVAIIQDSPDADVIRLAIAGLKDGGPIGTQAILTSTIRV